MIDRATYVEPLNYDEAIAIAHAHPDPVIQNLVGIAVSKARDRFALSRTHDGNEVQPRLPVASVDMVYYAHIACAFFSQTDFIRRIIAGEVVAARPLVCSPMALNDAKAEHIRLSISDPIERSLVTAALNEARQAFEQQESGGTFGISALPRVPFDMEFFATLMREYLSMVWLIERLLQGMSPGQASYWDLDDAESTI